MKQIPFDVKIVDIRESTEEILDLLIKQAELRDIKITAIYKGFPELMNDQASDNRLQIGGI